MEGGDDHFVGDEGATARHGTVALHDECMPGELAENGLTCHVADLGGGS